MASLKEKQREAILTFLSGRDTFVVLLTGYGKSLIYAMLPLVFDKLKGTYVVERDSRHPLDCTQLVWNANAAKSLS